MTTHESESPSRPIPISVGLLSRRSLVGGILVLGVALLFIFGVPALDHLVRGPNDFRPGEPYVVGGSVQITPVEGWSLEESEFFTSFTKSGASFLITPAVPDEQTPEEQAELTRTAYENDTTATWVIGQPQTFVTDAGDHGVRLTAHSAQQASDSWFIASEGQSVTLIGTTPEGLWTSLGPEMDRMARSVVVLAPDTEVTP